MDITIEIVHETTPELIEDLKRLLPQLLSNTPAAVQDNVEAVVNDPEVYLFVARLPEGQVVGTAQLATYPRIYGSMAWVEGVVVDGEQRGKGIATHLMQAVMDKAKELGLKELNLTSNAGREAANHLYLKMGFEPYETNYYRYKF